MKTILDEDNEDAFGIGGAADHLLAQLREGHGPIADKADVCFSMPGSRTSLFFERSGSQPQANSLNRAGINTPPAAQGSVDLRD